MPDIFELLPEMIDAVGCGFAVYNSRGTFLYVNKNYAEMFGVEQDELEGIGVWELNPRFEKERFREYWQSFEEGETRTVETHHRFAGRTVPVETRTTCRTIDGETYHFGSIQDVTERNLHERRWAQYLRAVEAAGHAIFLTDPDGTITYVNPAFEEITGYTKGEALGARPNILNSGEMSEEYWAEFWETICSGEQWEEVVINQRKSGAYYHANQTVAPVVDANGEIRAFVAIQNDLTDRIEAEQTINMFDHILRHNLRNRLNVITARAEKIAAGEARTVDSECEQILDSAHHLIETADKGHELVEFLSKSTYRRRVDVVTSVRTLVTSVREQCDDIQVSLDAPETACALAVEKLDRGLEELVYNAVEHNDLAALEIAISVEIVGDSVRVQVADTGEYIPAMERQVLSGTGNIDQLSHASGLGLSLVYWIIRRSGGSISISENEPRGNTICLTLERCQTETDF